MDYYDFQAHLSVCIAARVIEMEFQLNAAGVPTEGTKKQGDTIAGPDPQAIRKGNMRQVIAAKRSRIPK